MDEGLLETVFANEMKKEAPELVNATQAELDALLVLAREASFPKEQYQLLEGVLGTFVYLMQALQNTKTSLERFRKMLFGARTERKQTVLKDCADQPVEDGQGGVDGGALPTKPGAVGVDGEDKKRSGHGRNGAGTYTGACVIEVELPHLTLGAQCPACQTGKVYRWEPKVLVRLAGQPPLAATVYRLAQWRCRLCDTIFTASMPEGIAATKYDPSCASMIALLRYGSGMPFYRLEGLQAGLGIPLPDATQWDIVKQAAAGPRRIFQELIVQAAQGEVLHNDDTPARILALMGERAKEETANQEGQAATKAVRTSGIVSLAQTRKIVLFFTGPHHAGDNLAKVLAHRAKELAAPIQMCDALSHNCAGEFQTLLSNCLAHGRRKFVDIVDHFPDACRVVIDTLAQIYQHDAHCKKQRLSPDARLAYHQAHSGPLMKALDQWMAAQLEQRLVEPNSGLGEALRYMRNHWPALTLFLRKARAPLDNNICERALKKAILHRKNSYAYRTQRGAEIGDTYMSLIYTSQECGANPFEYLQALHIHEADVQAHAHWWFPWNYRERLSVLCRLNDDCHHAAVHT